MPLRPLRGSTSAPSAGYPCARHLGYCAGAAHGSAHRGVSVQVEAHGAGGGRAAGTLGGQHGALRGWNQGTHPQVRGDAARLPGAGKRCGGGRQPDAAPLRGARLCQQHSLTARAQFAEGLTNGPPSATLGAIVSLQALMETSRGLYSRPSERQMVRVPPTSPPKILPEPPV